MEIYLQTGQLFTVPTAVADHLLKLATHDQLKILLYVLCHANESLSEAQIVSACKVPQSAIAEALSFWQEVNVLHLTEPVAAVVVSQNAPAPQPAPAEPVTEAAVPVQEAVQTPDPAPVPETPKRVTSSSVSATPSEIADYINKHPEAVTMFDNIVSETGQPPSFLVQKSVYWMHDYLGLPLDVIMMLVRFCIRNGSFSPKYMDEIAFDWAEKGITTHELAQKDIQRRENNKQYAVKIMRVLYGSDTRVDPTKAQQKYILQWFDWGLSVELVEFACERSREYKGNKSILSYIHKVLTRWHEQGILTVAAAEQDEAAFRESAKQRKKPASGDTAPDSPGSSIDMDEIARLVNAV